MKKQPQGQLQAAGQPPVLARQLVGASGTDSLAKLAEGEEIAVGPGEGSGGARAGAAKAAAKLSFVLGMGVLSGGVQGVWGSGVLACT